MTEQWTIQEVAKATGTTSRTLRHYDAIGLLAPTEIGANGYRLYDTHALIRLQRILALRDLGMSLTDISTVLSDEMSEADALVSLERQLRREAGRLQRQISSIQRTIVALQKGESPMTKDMFDGFDHDQYKDEVEERWGQDAYARSDSWWKSKSEAERAAWQKQLATLNAGWQQACADGVLPESEIAQALAKRHVEWLCGIPGTPTSNAEELAGYVRGLGEMYVNDPRFAANYGGEAGAAFVRDALNAYLDRT